MNGVGTPWQVCNNYAPVRKLAKPKALYWDFGQRFNITLPVFSSSHTENATLFVTWFPLDARYAVAGDEIVPERMLFYFARTRFCSLWSWWLPWPTVVCLRFPGFCSRVSLTKQRERQSEYSSYRNVFNVPVSMGNKRKMNVLSSTPSEGTSKTSPTLFSSKIDFFGAQTRKKLHSISLSTTTRKELGSW